MARILALTDRLPADADWKGAWIWLTIASLCDSQHEVVAVTPHDPSAIDLTHSRLTITQPIRSLSATQWPWLMTSLLAFHPDVIHVFAPKPASGWTALSFWPYLTAGARASLRAQRFATIFDADDCARDQAVAPWLNEAHAITTFSAEAETQARAAFGRPTHIMPLDRDGTLAVLAKQTAGADAIPLPPDLMLVPQCVQQWPRPAVGLEKLALFLTAYPERHIGIVGGWGRLPTAERRAGWRRLQACAARVHLLPDMGLAQFAATLSNAAGLWLEPLAGGSWRFLIGRELALSLNKPVLSERPGLTRIQAGSTANALSRLYTQ